MLSDWGAGVPSRAGLTIAAVGPLPAEAIAAIDASGGRVLHAIEWESLGDPAPEDALAGASVVVAAVPGDSGQGALERLATILEEARIDAVIAFEEEAIDVVSAALMGSRVVLLCDPSPVDWAVALATVALRVGTMPAGVREGGGDVERLRWMNEEVARIAALLAGLVEEGRVSAAVDDRRRGYASEPAVAAPIDAAEIRRTIRARRLRGQFFDPRLLEDPGWDMLLDLFAAELEGLRVSVSSLCIAASVAPTTALRWISRMVDAGLMVRVADPGDRRRAFIALSATAGMAIRRYVAAVKKAGLAIV